MKAIDHADLLATPGREIHLSDFDPALTCAFKKKRDAQAKLRADIKRLSRLSREILRSRAICVAHRLSGHGPAGKDGAIKHVMSGVNAQGVHVYSFKTPSMEELAHDYLWRSTKVLPERGRIGIFNRSYYEEVGVVRVHASLLESERLPPLASGSDLWHDRFQDIVAFECHLSRNGTLIVKFFLHLKQLIRDRLIEHHRYINQHGDDPPEIKGWKWSVPT